MRGKIRGGSPAPPRAHHPSGSLAASAETFLTHLAARAYSPPSIEAHRWALKGFVEWAGSQELTTPASFTRARIEAFQLHLHQYRTPRGGKPLVTNTQLARLGCVRRFFAWLCRSGVIPANPAADLDLPRKQARQLPKAFSAKEIQVLMAIPDPTDAFGLRDRAILELFYATGIRRTEMVNLDHGDYDPASLTLTVRKGKGGKSRMLPVGERAAAWLDRFLAESRPLFHHLPQETALFLSGYGSRITPAYIGNWIKGLMKSCGIDKPGSCHLLRHSCATDMHRGGADIRYVQEMLGHARMETTQIYTHVHIDALREIHARTHPHGRLDENRDMYGLISATETPEHDLPSPPAEDPLQPEAMWVATAPGPEVSAVQAGISNGSCPEPPDEEPPAGGSPCATPKPPPTGGPSSAKSPFALQKPAQKSTEFQRFRLGVAYYGYRWFDPETGRWPSRDPIAERGGINLYGFVRNDGVNWVDVFGQWGWLQDSLHALLGDIPAPIRESIDTVEFVHDQVSNIGEGLGSGNTISRMTGDYSNMVVTAEIGHTITTPWGAHLAVQAVVFLGDCKVYFFWIAPVTNSEPIQGLDGLRFSSDISASILNSTSSIAYYQGEGRPGPENWSGDFFGASVNFSAGRLAGVNLGVFSDPQNQWAGYSIGGGFGASLLPASYSTTPDHYTMMVDSSGQPISYDLPQDVCDCLRHMDPLGGVMNFFN